MNGMNNEWLIELTKETARKIDEILSVPSKRFVEIYGTEVERVDKARIEKAQTLNGTLLFFISKATGEEVVRQNVPENE